MKWIVDAQLPLKLARFLRDRGYDTLHTRDLPMGNKTPDAYISNLSVQEQRIVITKDSDFVESFLLNKIPYKLLLISTGNITNVELEAIFQRSIQQIESLFDNYDYIELGRDEVIIHQ
jgi:predicted nuclease of predicted toxin-antitoxin system